MTSPRQRPEEAWRQLSELKFDYPNINGDVKVSRLTLKQLNAERERAGLKPLDKLPPRKRGSKQKKNGKPPSPLTAPGRAKHAPAWIGERRTCPVCGTSFAARTKNQRYCKPECNTKAKARRMLGAPLDDAGWEEWKKRRAEQR